MATKKLIGHDIDQVPTNGNLGQLAYLNRDRMILVFPTAPAYDTKGPIYVPGSGLMVWDGAGYVSALDQDMVGLDQVDNTSDAEKPVSTAQATALAAKLDKASDLSDLTNAETARTNLGLGSIATSNITISTSDPSGGVDGDIWFKV